ncbi:hypothetical protein ACTG2W_04920 [Aeromonas sp. 96A]|uniref:hypothetical protein n=1 Tax=Aeromonas TaxID=642 RepID=UPI0005364DD5|nr:hypothetical protein [Aeromonas hydrophila]EKP0309447.1 hypothetical protein [Aeromonas veronii]EKP0312412.1 hypothetical protein [Aeromonas veronii]PNO51186.1 hypothetical protein MC69_007740 [Aeromonas hydrophila]
MDSVRFKQLMKARGHWRDAELTSAEPAFRDERGIVKLIEKNTGYWVDDESQCEAPANPLANGIFIWTEIKGTGHAFISVHENNSPFVFTYGRFGRVGEPLEAVGDGILNALSYGDARDYYRKQLYEMGAKVFLIDDADISITKKYFERLWARGSPAKQTEGMRDSTKRNGHTIDQYDVTGVNCTTHVTKGIKFSGSRVFDGGYTTNSLMRIDSEEDFAVPLSLQRYLEDKSRDPSMLVVDMTSEFKKQYPNTDGIAPMDESSSRVKAYRAMSEVASSVGKLSPYSGGTVGGFLEGAYDVNQ